MILTFDAESEWAGPLVQSGIYLYYDKDLRKNIICKGKFYKEKPCIRESSFGFCQFNKYYQSSIVENPRFSNAYWQINKCIEKYKEYENRGVIGKRFYGYNTRLKRKFKYKYP